MAKLTDIPEELVSNIAARLYADDNAAFRLTCRTLEKKSFHEFGKEYFSQKAFMITTDSLKVLQAISRSERLKSFLHHVHFIPALFSQRATDCCHGASCVWQASVKQKEAYQDYIEDQKTLVETKQDKKMIMDAFAKLSNLVAVSLIDLPTAIPADIDLRGRNKVQRVTGRDASLKPIGSFDREFSTFFRHVWTITLQALSKSPALRELHTNLIRQGGYLPIEWLNPKKFTHSTKALNSLHAVSLNLGCPDEEDYNEGEFLLSPAFRRQLVMVSKFASLLTSLTSLVLKFDSPFPAHSGVQYLTFTRGLDMSKLTKLSVDGMHIGAKQLAASFVRLSSVKDLRLTYVALDKGTWVPVLKSIITLLEHLEHLHLMYLMEGSRKVYLLKRKEKEAPPYPFDELLDGDFVFPPGEAYETDDDMPGLAPGDTSGCFEHHHSSHVDAPSDDMTPLADASKAHNSTTALAKAAPVCKARSNPFYLGDSDPDTGGRGFYVCVQGKEIAEQLPIFMEEYNTFPDDNDLLKASIDPNYNAFLNILTSAFGGPPAGFTGGTPAFVGPNAAQPGVNGTTVPILVGVSPPTVANPGQTAHTAAASSGVSGVQVDAVASAFPQLNISPLPAAPAQPAGGDPEWFTEEEEPEGWY